MPRGQDLADVLSVAFSFFGNAAMAFAIVRWDEGRLTPEQLERAWPESTRLAACVVFSPFCLITHFRRTRTRRGSRAVKLLSKWKGRAIGALFALGVFAVDAGFSALLERLLT